MSDARALLRASREARKIKHPHASYTTDNKLLCNICSQPIKSEAAWTSHLHSTGHTLRMSRAQEASRKRKAEHATSSPNENHPKKPKPSSVTFAPGIDEDVEEPPRIATTKTTAEQKHVEHQPVQPPSSRTLDDNQKEKEEEEEDAPASAEDLAAFEAQLAALEAEHQPQVLLQQQQHPPQPTISAPAMSAEQLAAQAREEQSNQKGKREAELEAEKEDAARLLEEEFEEMEGLETRARKLREKREALRKGWETDLGEEDRGEVEVEVEVKDGEGGEVGADGAGNEVDDDDDDESEDEEEDLWDFGGR